MIPSTTARKPQRNDLTIVIPISQHLRQLSSNPPNPSSPPIHFTTQFPTNPVKRKGESASIGKQSKIPSFSVDSREISGSSCRMPTGIDITCSLFANLQFPEEFGGSPTHCQEFQRSWLLQLCSGASSLHFKYERSVPHPLQEFALLLGVREYKAESQPS